MPTAEDMALLKEQQRELDISGIPGNIISNPRPTAQWYRADGYALPNMLPADPYHIRRYTARGWSMIPPQPTLNESAKAEVELAVGAVLHAHRYSRAMGSPCKVQGCAEVRTTEFMKRKQRS